MASGSGGVAGGSGGVVFRSKFIWPVLNSWLVEFGWLWVVVGVVMGSEVGVS